MRTHERRSISGFRGTAERRNTLAKIAKTAKEELRKSYFGNSELMNSEFFLGDLGGLGESHSPVPVSHSHIARSAAAASTRTLVLASSARSADSRAGGQAFCSNRASS